MRQLEHKDVYNMTLTLSYTTLILDLPTGSTNLAKQKLKQKFGNYSKLYYIE